MAKKHERSKEEERGDRRELVTWRRMQGSAVKL